MAKGIFDIGFSSKSLTRVKPEALEENGLDLETATPQIALDHFSKLAFQAGRKIPQRRVTHYTKGDRIRAIQALRSVTIYANEHQSIFFITGTAAKGKYAPEQTVLQAIEKLDKMEQDLLQGSRVKKKSAWKREVRSLETSVNEVFGKCLDPALQNAFGNIVERSLKALKSLYR